MMQTSCKGKRYLWWESRESWRGQHPRMQTIITWDMKWNTRLRVSYIRWNVKRENLLFFEFDWKYSYIKVELERNNQELSTASTKDVCMIYRTLVSLFNCYFGVIQMKYQLFIAEVMEDYSAMEEDELTLHVGM